MRRKLRRDLFEENDSIDFALKWVGTLFSEIGIENASFFVEATSKSLPEDHVINKHAFPISFWWYSRPLWPLLNRASNGLRFVVRLFFKYVFLETEIYFPSSYCGHTDRFRRI